MYKTSRKYRKSEEEVDLEYDTIYNQRVVNTYNPGTPKEYFYFRRKTERKKDKDLTLTEYRTIVHSIYEAVRDLMLEYEGGVFLDRYGYFSLLIIPYKNNGLKIGEWYYNSFMHTDGYRYVPILDTDVSTKSCIRKMIMDRTYNQKTKRKFWELINNGFRPKNYYSTLKSIFGHGNAKIL